MPRTADESRVLVLTIGHDLFYLVQALGVGGLAPHARVLAEALLDAS
jgi:hypothetical protein